MLSTKCRCWWNEKFQCFMILSISPTGFYLDFLLLWCRICFNFAMMMSCSSHLLQIRRSLWDVYHAYWHQDNWVFEIFYSLLRYPGVLCCSNHRVSGGRNIAGSVRKNARAVTWKGNWRSTIYPPFKTEKLPSVWEEISPDEARVGA